jgi:hypothetical protein
VVIEEGLWKCVVARMVLISVAWRALDLNVSAHALRDRAKASRVAYLIA